MERGRVGRSLFRGCNSIDRKIFSHASSSQSLEGGAMATTEAWEESSHASGLKKRFPRLYPSAFVNKFKGRNHDEPKAGLGMITGVLIPTFENMFGVLIFLRFYYIVGNAGFWQTSCAILLSFSCAISTVISLSAIATNGPIEEGGTYYLISRALGPNFGGAVGIMYYLGVSLLSVLESLGAVEMLLFTFPGLHFPSSNRVISASIIAFLGFLVYFGIGFVSKLSLAFFLVVLYTMCSYYFGLFFAPHGNVPTTLTGLKWSTFKGNWNSGYDPKVDFYVALAIFFPCFTGILSGADRAKNLASPQRSIPTGTILAVTISLVIYLSYMGLWAAVGTRDYLLGRAADGTKRGHGQNLEVVTDVALPLAILTQLGIIVASMAQALQCLITSPRLLQAIAADGVIPFLGRLSKTSKTGEPRAALVVTTILCMLATMIGSLDAVAPLVSICFLSAYSALNLSCFIQSVFKSPSWRPKWKFYHWSAAGVGCVLCIVVSFLIKYYMALAAFAVQGFIFVYIDYLEVDVDWGTGLGGFLLQFAMRIIIRHGHEARYTVNWRPQLLCLCKPRSARDAEDDNNQEFMSFVSQLKKGRGLCVFTTILEGTMRNMAPQVEAERLELENAMQTANVAGFSRVLVSPSYREGKTYAIQSSGLGAFEPNTLVLGWPNKWREDGHYHSAQAGKGDVKRVRREFLGSFLPEVLLEILDECKAVNKAALVCMHLNKFPTDGTVQEGYVDVWWIVHDGGLLLMLAHLLKQHRIWRKCKLRVHVVSEKFHDPVAVKKTMEKMLDKVRIEAEVQVIVMDADGLAPYTYDNTIRITEAMAFVNEVAQYRAAQEQQRRPELTHVKTKALQKEGNEMPSEGLESAKSPRVSKTGDRPSLDTIFNDRSPDRQIPDMLETVYSREELLHDRAGKSAIDDHSQKANRGGLKWLCGANIGKRVQSDLVELQEHLPPKQKAKLAYPATMTKSQSGRNVDHILKNIIPAELSMLEDIPYEPRPRHGPPHAPKTQIGADSADKLNSERDLRSSTSGIVKGDGLKQGRREETTPNASQTRLTTGTTSTVSEIEDGRSPTSASKRRSALPLKSESADPLRSAAGTGEHPDSSASESTETATEASRHRREKEMRWADEPGDNHEEMPELEIIVEETKETQDDIEEEGGGRPMVRKGSAGELYPGSPHNSDYAAGISSTDVPEEMMARTWETFSQSYTSNELNERIFEESKNARLVVVNLPDNYSGMEPKQYMEFVEEITKGLPRVLLVHGSRKELWGADLS